VALQGPNGFKESPALVILNICRDPILREARAKSLHDAGYYTSAAQTAQEAITLAMQMNCAIAIVCHLFTAPERRLIQVRFQEIAPTTTVVFLGKSSDRDPRVLVSTIKTAVASREAWDIPQS
jgi:hypothetical protein